jgi:diamine N-acetyltransferase
MIRSYLSGGNGMIESKRTYLRPLERADLPKRMMWLNDPIIRETLLLRFPVSLAETELWFERVLSDPTRKDFIIVLKADDRVIGFCGYVNIDLVHRKAEPFIAIGDKECWGKGFGSEVVRTLLNYGFNELRLNRQYGYMLDNNPGALKMDLRAGYKKEGLLKQDVIIHGEYHDRIMLGITRDEFNADQSTEPISIEDKNVKDV